MSTSEIQSQNNISIVYSNNFIELYFLAREPNIQTLKILNLNGVEVFSQSIESRTVKISKEKFQNGIYFYALSNNASLIKSGKLIIVN
ncbi:MAG: T9SS type A sorting domain-containing protein [Bacteroidetes bacterium]|nr:T9SS type A sorting domain-containing protein [Bacteroidota bacterium]